MNTSNYIELALFVVGILLVVYGFIYRLDRRVSAVENRCVTLQTTVDSIASLNEKVDKVFNDNEVFWRVIGPHLENIIHSPKSVDRDDLVAKLIAGTIEKEELPTLISLLQQALTKPEWTYEKKLAGAWLLGRCYQLLNEPEFDRRDERRSA